MGGNTNAPRGGGYLEPRGSGDTGPTQTAAVAVHDATTADRPVGWREAAASAPTRRAGLVTLYPRADAEGPADAWPIARPALVGRGQDSTLRLADGCISRAHAMVEPRADGIFLRDLGSRHGTFVAGERVGAAGAPAPLGSVVRFGETLMHVVEDVERFRSPRRRIDGPRLGLAKDVVAGPSLAAVWDQAARVAARDEPVLILGETGSGKECVARIVHSCGEGGGPFVGVNVSALPEALFEAELFGHEKGAFTGASTAREGAFREAAGGVLFLDEVGDLRADLQAKLLRTLDLGRVRPLGAGRDVAVDARVVSATSRDLLRACERGTFRTDLWYRLSGIVLRVPPLRERPDDVILLAQESLRTVRTPLRLSVDAAEILALASWEGNARQLRHVMASAIERALTAGDGEIRPEYLPDLGPPIGQGEEAPLSARGVEQAMRQAGGVASRAALLLGVSRTTLYAAMKRFKLDLATLRERGR